MRKFLLILLNVLCLMGMNAQTRNRVSLYSFELNSTNDTVAIYNDYKYYYDKKTCLDTFNTVQLFSYNYLSKTERKRFLKYDKQNRLIEKLHIDSSFIRTDLKSPYVFNGLSKKREVYVYTPSTVRADSMFYEIYNTTTNTWTRNTTTYMGKPGVGTDTFRLGLKTKVYDSNANLILELIKNNSGITVDSIVTSYLNNQKSKILVYFNGKLQSVTNYNYDGAKILLERKLSYSDGVVIDTNTHAYLYKNGLLESDEYEFKSYSYNPVTKVKTYSSYDKYNDRYTYDLNNNIETQKSFMWDFTQNKWVINWSDITTYSPDSLKVKITTSNYTDGVLAPNTIVYNWTYEWCSPVLSDIKDINQGIDFTLVPNPSTGLFNLSLSEEALQSGASVSVYNIQGGEVFRTKLTSESMAIDLSNLSKGFYLVKVADKTHSSVKKLVLN
jgi:Secretion system C-terminal sorting domain